MEKLTKNMPSGIYPRTKEHRDKIKKGMEKVKEKVRESIKRRYASGEKFGFQRGNKFGATSFLGKKHTKEARRKIRKARKKQVFSTETREKFSIAHRGEKGSNWKGGRTKLGGIIRKCFKYRQWRSDVFTRDNFTCILCGKKGGWLEVDHYPKKFSKILDEYQIKSLEEALNCEELWNINNGRTLCLKCHNKTKQNKNYGKIVSNDKEKSES